MRKLLLILCSLLASHAAAFPEMFRYGYTNCQSCHHSPTGGGVLSPYGRKIAEEVLSSWARENEGKALYGIVPSTPWLHVGGDFRVIQLFFDQFPRNPLVMIMQAEAEIAVQPASQWTFAVSLGRNDRTRKEWTDHFLFSRRYYGLYQIDNNWTLRAGKFFPAFGIHDPDHTLLIKDKLGWGEGSETHNLELGWKTPDWDLFATALFARVEDRDVDLDNGIALRAGVSLDNDFRVGTSYLFGHRQDLNRHVFGTYAYWNLSRRLLFETEWDATVVSPRGPLPSVWGYAVFNKLDFEVSRGLHVFAVQEISRTRWGDPNTQADGVGGGIQFFPRPHFDFQFTYKRRQDLPGTGGKFQNLFFFVTHLYV